MGGIMDGHVEWAVINRLKAMLDEPPATKFNVTQTFALFSAVLLWTKNRGWVAGNNVGNVNFADAADQAAHNFRQLLGNEVITSQPWSLQFNEARNSNRRLDLHFYEADMRRIGSLLADRFCMALAAAPTYYNEDIATRVLEAGKVA